MTAIAASEPTAKTAIFPGHVHTWVEQAGAICYRPSRCGKEVDVLLVTSRRNGAWGIPKGHVERGETTYAAAAREAFTVLSQATLRYTASGRGSRGSFEASPPRSCAAWHADAFVIVGYEPSVSLPGNFRHFFNSSRSRSTPEGFNWACQPHLPGEDEGPRGHQLDGRHC